MYFKRRNDALLEALRLAGVEVDPERLMNAARSVGRRVPGVIAEANISAASLGGYATVGYRIDRSAIGELRKLVEDLSRLNDEPAPTPGRAKKTAAA